MLRLLYVSVLFLICIYACSKNQKVYDVCISGGTIVDGTGNPAFTGNVYVLGDKIVLISKEGEPVLPAKELIDAKGFYVAPGFIDAHSHSDYTLLVDGFGRSKTKQGVTTEILGESDSGGPVFGPAIVSKERDLKQLELTCTWKTLGEYFERLRQSGIAVNVASFVGLGEIRMCVMGEINRPPTPEEMQKMKDLIAEGMKEGAIGLAAGLIYVPDMYTTTDELVDLASVTAQHGGIFSAHIRSEDDKLLESLDEMVTISKKAHIPVHVMHFKSSKKAYWHLTDAAIKKIDEARKEGINITADQYPYAASMTTLNLILPDQTREGGIDSILARLKNPQERQKIKNFIRNEKYGFGSYQEYFKTIMIASVISEKNRPFEGKILWNISKEQKKDPIDFVLDFITEEQAQISVIYFSMNEENKEKEFRQPWLCVGSDGSAIKPEGVLGKGHPHPRFYGTFPRVINQFIMTKKLVSLEEGIRKMTSLPAEIFQLKNRGLLQKENFADIVIFNLQSMKDNATFENPHQFSSGVEYLIVNGKKVIKKGEFTGEKPGRVVTK